MEKDYVKTFHPDTNPSVLVLRSGPAGPVLELLPEQNRLLVLRNAAEQGPGWTALPPPGDTSKSDLVKLELFKIQNERELQEEEL